MPLVINENNDQPREDKELGERLSHKLTKGNINCNKFSGEVFISWFQKKFNLYIYICPLDSDFPLDLL